MSTTAHCGLLVAIWLTQSASVAAQPAEMPKQGRSKTTMEGCLQEQPRPKSGPRTERGGTRVKEEASVKTNPQGIEVLHRFNHPCCLRGRATTAINTQARKVVVKETLSGMPCECLCSSTILTKVGLARGDWRVIVQESVTTRWGGSTKTVIDQTVKVEEE